MTLLEWQERIERDFTYHPVKGNQAARYEDLRKAAKELAHKMVLQCPNSRELSLAITHLENAVFYANASIARNE